MFWEGWKFAKRGPVSREGLWKNEFSRESSLGVLGLVSWWVRARWLVGLLRFELVQPMRRARRGRAGQSARRNVGVGICGAQVATTRGPGQGSSSQNEQTKWTPLPQASPKQRKSWNFATHPAPKPTPKIDSETSETRKFASENPNEPEGPKRLKTPPQLVFIHHR